LVGHSPFSHASEWALDLFADRAKLEGRFNPKKPEKIHELVMQDLLRSDSSLLEILGKSTLKFENASDLFNSIQEKLNDPRFAIFVPVAYENPVERRELRNKIKEPILKVLEDIQP
jgi:hypothetical protein